MQIAGFIKNSFIDYPGKISSVIFLQGCNLRCGYCHNPELIPTTRNKQFINPEEVLNYLKKNKGLIDALVISGGEALRSNIEPFLKEIKVLDLKIKIDTNGCFPEALKKYIKKDLIDFIAMDIKHIPNLNTYQQICGKSVNHQTITKIKSSIDLIKKSNISHQFRTTVIKNIHSTNDLLYICKIIGKQSWYCIQNFNSITVFDERFKQYSGFNQEELKELKNTIEPLIYKLTIRE